MARFREIIKTWIDETVFDLLVGIGILFLVLFICFLFFLFPFYGDRPVYRTESGIYSVHRCFSWDPDAEICGVTPTFHPQDDHRKSIQIKEGKACRAKWIL